MARQVTVQVVGVLAVLAWSGGVSLLLLKILDRGLGVRVGADEETEALDIVLHDERGYSL